ncbi:MAG: helix-turn-helix domain-containing protein [Actinomycetota bacterium]|nr:helix-turn-helix domain-containing protein [Actinomycetota bacterium]
MKSEDPTPARPSGETAGVVGEDVGEAVRASGEDSGRVTTKVAAKTLGVSRRMVQEYVRRGELQAVVEGKGVNKTYYVSIDSLNVLRERREAKDSPKLTDSSPMLGHPANPGERIGEGEGGVLHQVIQRLEARTAEAAELKARLELAARAETTAREERERLLADFQRERERADRLEEELRQARRGWLRRFFGF